MGDTGSETSLSAPINTQGTILTHFFMTSAPFHKKKDIKISHEAIDVDATKMIVIPTYTEYGSNERHMFLQIRTNKVVGGG